MDYLTNFESLKNRSEYQNALLSLTKGQENTPLVESSLFSRNEDANRAKMTTIVKNFIKYGQDNGFFQTDYDHKRAEKLQARLKLAPVSVVSTQTLVDGALAITAAVAAVAAVYYHLNPTGTSLPQQPNLLLEQPPVQTPNLGSTVNTNGDTDTRYPEKGAYDYYSERYLTCPKDQERTIFDHFRMDKLLNDIISIQPQCYFYDEPTAVSVPSLSPAPAPAPEQAPVLRSTVNTNGGTWLNEIRADNYCELPLPPVNIANRSDVASKYPLENENMNASTADVSIGECPVEVTGNVSTFAKVAAFADYSLSHCPAILTCNASAPVKIAAFGDNFSNAQCLVPASNETTTPAKVAALADYIPGECPAILPSNVSKPVYGSFSVTAAKTEEVSKPLAYTIDLSEAPKASNMQLQIVATK